VRTAFAFLLCAACGGQDLRAYVPPIPSGSEDVAVHSPVPGHVPGVPLTIASGISDRLRLVVRDRATWESLWQEIFARISPHPALPEVDFATDMVLVASMGSRPSGGYGILVDGAVEAADKTLIAEVTETAPGPDCVVTAATTAPVDAVVVPRHDQVSFAERSETRRCR